MPVAACSRPGQGPSLPVLALALPSGLAWPPWYKVEPQNPDSIISHPPAAGRWCQCFLRRNVPSVTVGIWKSISFIATRNGTRRHGPNHPEAVGVKPATYPQ